MASVSALFVSALYRIQTLAYRPEPQLQVFDAHNPAVPDSGRSDCRWCVAVGFPWSLRRFTARPLQSSRESSTDVWNANFSAR